MTRLGNAAECRKAGRNARLMGDHWRHQKREKISFAANGLLSDIWSYCADQATDRISVDAMRKLTSADRKNAGRMLKQLVAAGYLEAITTGWAIHDWVHHNPIAKTVQLRVVAGGAETRAETRAETLAERNPPLEIIEEPCVPRTRALTQDPGIKERTPPAVGGADTPRRAKCEPKKARPKDPKRALLTRVLEASAAAHGFLAAKLLTHAQAEGVLAKAGKLAEREGVELEVALRRNVEGAWERHHATGKDLKWCVVDWQPGQPARPSYGRPAKLEIAGCSPASAFGTEEEAWAKVLARRAEIEAEKAARAAAQGSRRVGA